MGHRVGVPWLGWTCGECSYLRRGQENLCERARFTGYTLDGGYAEFTVADERFCVPIPDSYSDVEAAPLLCAGLIGYRSLVRAGDAKRLGIYGFGAAAHIIAQVAAATRDAASTRSRGPAMRKRSNLRGRLGRGLGRRTRTSGRRKNSTPRLFLRPLARWFPRRSPPFAREDRSSAAAFT